MSDAVAAGAVALVIAALVIAGAVLEHLRDRDHEQAADYDDADRHRRLLAELDRQPRSDR